MVSGVIRLRASRSVIVGRSGGIHREPQVEFIQPDVQTGRITCHVTDAQQNARREGPWAEFRMNAAGHFTAYVAPGVFASTCGFAPGRYTYRVRVLDGQMRPLEEKLGQLGTITVE